jgi:hypothetical protein
LRGLTLGKLRKDFLAGGNLLTSLAFFKWVNQARGAFKARLLDIQFSVQDGDAVMV